MHHTRRINMRQVMLTFFHQVFCLPDPDARLTSACGFIVSQVLVQRFAEADAFTQGNAKGFVSFQTKLLEIFHALVPTAIA